MKLTLTEQIEKKKQEIKELEEKQKIQMEKTDWLTIPELGIEVQTKIHHKGKTLAQVRADLKGGEEVASYEQLQWLRNSKYCNALNLLNSWEYVYPNPDKICADKGYVANFGVDSGGADLCCNWDADGSFSGRGVRFVRKISKASSKKK
jgi:hypothetical protein